MSSIYIDFTFTAYRGSPLIDASIDGHDWQARLSISGQSNQELGIILSVDYLKKLASKLVDKYEGALFKSNKDKTEYGQFSKVIEVVTTPSLQAITEALISDAVVDLRQNFDRGKYFVKIDLDSGRGYGYESSRVPV